jgi:hypothetical protein
MFVPSEVADQEQVPDGREDEDRDWGLEETHLPKVNQPGLSRRGPSADSVQS